MTRVALALGVLLSISCSRPTLPSFGVVPYFQLVDQSGAAFDSNMLDGSIWVANFIFTNCPGPCPRMTGQMKQLFEQAKRTRGLQMVSFTVDPARDTPAVLLAYAQRFGASGLPWHFLTGPQTELQKLSRSVFLLGDIDGSLQHSTRFALVDRQRRIRGFYDSSDRETIQQLIADIQHLD